MSITSGPPTTQLSEMRGSQLSLRLEKAIAMWRQELRVTTNALGGAAKDAIKILTNVSDPTDYDSAGAAVQAAINA